jgi:hypothetical protein
MRRNRIDFRGARLVRYLAPFVTTPRTIIRVVRMRVARDPPFARAHSPPVAHRIVGASWARLTGALAS